MDSFIGDWCNAAIIGGGADVSIEACSADLSAQPRQWIQFQTTFTALLNLGAMLGALGSNVAADRLGRRATIASACLAFTVGTLMQACVPADRSWSLALLYIA